MAYLIKPAKINDKEIIRKMLQPYLTELSRFDDISPDPKNEKGEYVYPYLDNYWEEADRHPYLFNCSEKIAGFALVSKEGDHYEMAEFYVLPEFRHRGVGTACAADIFRKHAGHWRIGFNRQNQASRQLWKKMTRNLAKGNIEEGETDTSHDYLRFLV